MISFGFLYYPAGLLVVVVVVVVVFVVVVVIVITGVHVLALSLVLQVIKNW